MSPMNADAIYRSQLPSCSLCQRSDYPPEYGPNQIRLPAGSWVIYETGETVWICRRCSRDPVALARLEQDPSILENTKIKDA